MKPTNPGTLDLLQKASAIAGDHDSGAAELTTQLLSVLSDAVSAGGEVALDVARIVLAGQRAMAPLWHACAAAVIDKDQPGTFERRRAEMERAPRALVRAASFALRDLFTDERQPLVLTLSYSSSVVEVLRELASTSALRVVCGEGRPRFEGRRAATELAQSGVEVTLVVDAALSAMLRDGAAVVVGADAVTSDHWINKVGTFGSAAAAALRGVPVYVIAARDKFVPRVLAPRMVPLLADAAEVWADRPTGVLAQNPYFENVPTGLATLFLTDGGPLPPADLDHAVERQVGPISFLLSRLP